MSDKDFDNNALDFFENELKIKTLELNNLITDMNEKKQKIYNLESQKNKIENEVFQIKTALEYLRGMNV